MDKEYYLIIKLFDGTIKEKIIILKDIDKELSQYKWGDIEEINLKEVKKNEKSKCLQLRNRQLNIS